MQNYTAIEQQKNAKKLLLLIQQIYLKIHPLGDSETGLDQFFMQFWSRNLSLAIRLSKNLIL